MILVDTSVWVDHLMWGDAKLESLLDAGKVLMHPFVVGELAVGVLQPRQQILAMLQNLPAAKPATDGEVLRFIEVHSLWGKGIGYVDAHLLAAARLDSEAGFWTRDKRLTTIAENLELARHE